MFVNFAHIQTHVVKRVEKKKKVARMKSDGVYVRESSYHMEFLRVCMYVCVMCAQAITSNRYLFVYCFACLSGEKMKPCGVETLQTMSELISSR